MSSKLFNTSQIPNTPKLPDVFYYDSAKKEPAENSSTVFQNNMSTSCTNPNWNDTSKTKCLFDNKPCDEITNYARDGSPVYIIKNTLYNKDIILCPNYFSEAIINSILQRINPFTPSFISMNGALYDNRDNEYPMYIISELLQNFDWMNSEALPYYLFQLFFGLYIAQKTLKYTNSLPFTLSGNLGEEVCYT
jgi:hypothetical protein